MLPCATCHPLVSWLSLDFSVSVEKKEMEKQAVACCKKYAQLLTRLVNS